MSVSPLPCPKCRQALPEAVFNLGRFAACPGCGSSVECEVFPAFFAAPRIGRPGEPLVDGSEASCFFHPAKRAAIACESCGRFLCALCDLELDGRHICPPCLAAGRKKGSLKNLDQFRLSWPGIALLVAIVPPIVLYPITPISALASIGVVIYGWRKPGSLTGDRKIPLSVFAILFALGEIALSFYIGRNLLNAFRIGNAFK